MGNFCTDFDPRWKGNDFFTHLKNRFKKEKLNKVYFF